MSLGAAALPGPDKRLFSAAQALMEVLSKTVVPPITSSKGNND
jgi:hypothetical protein